MMATKKKLKKPGRKLDASEQLTTPEEIESTPQGIVKRWVAELNLAEEAESDWRKEAEKIWERYEAEKLTASSFNILWSNTEILEGAVYNSTPKPDVRRRFRDRDPLGKAISKILVRSLEYEVDDYDFDDEMKAGVLDVLIPGRAVIRIKYDPKIIQVTEEGGATMAPAPGSYQEPQQAEIPPAAADGLPSAPEGNAAAPAPRERLADQNVPCEHVQWDDFRRGYAKRWRDVPWIGFRHEFTYDMAIEAFGAEVASELKYQDSESAQKATRDKAVRSMFKVCEVWEIWDKATKRVLFIAPTLATRPCKVVDDPLHLRNFWPCPRPAYAILSSRSLKPIPLYRQYEAQARELDAVTARINKTVTALKLRGAYQSALEELADLMKADDLEMIPIKSSAELAAMGGLDKSIWIMPVEKLIEVLRGLYEARTQLKQTIYEIVGIADVLRGASDPDETASAQKIKSKWGSIRVQKMQREIQRLARDLVRLKAEVIAEQFTPQHLTEITQVNLPTQQQKMQAQAIAKQAQQTGQPLPPNIEQMLEAPTWEEALHVLRSDRLRSYRIDIETDSTVAESIDADMTGLSELLQSLSGWVQGAFQAMQQGTMSIEQLKEIALAVIRRARLGNAVEDAFEQLKAPPPAPDQGQQLEAMKQQLLELIKGEGTKLAQTEQGIAARSQEVDEVIANLGQGAQATAEHAMQTQAVAQNEQRALGELTGSMQQFTQMVATVMQGLQSVEAALTAPKQVSFERGADNKIVAARAATGSYGGKPTHGESQMIGAMTQLATLMQRLEAAISAPKQITFTRDPKSQRITGATAA